MYSRAMIPSLMLVLLFFCTQVLAFGSSNSRLLGFGGTGVAVVPLKGQTAMAINPAAPGFMEQRQINFNLDYLAGERTTHWTRVTENPLAADSTGFGAGGEFYFPLGPVNLFFGLGSEFDTVESTGTAWHHYYMMAEEKISSTSIKPFLGLAGSFSDVVSVGGRMLYWHNDTTDGPDGGSFEFNHDARLFAGEFGILVVTPIELNFGLTWSTEDSEVHRDEIRYSSFTIAQDYLYGMPSTLRIGTAYQKEDGSWLAGVEYAIVDDLDLVFGDHDLTHTFPGEKLVTVYGEYWFGKFGLRGGAGRRVMDDTTHDNDHWRDYISPVESDSWVLSAGCTYRKSDKVGFDFFLQKIDGDGTTSISTFDDEYWRLGFGMTFLN